MENEMRHARRESRIFTTARATLPLLAAFAALTAASPAHADEVSPTGKGIVGGALLGAEIVTIPMALANVQSGVAYGVGAGLGAAAGGVGGYFVEQNVDDGRVPVYMLAGGLALVIPAVVMVLNATTYKPVDGVREDRAPSGPPADPGTVGGSVVIGAPPAGSPPPAPATTPAAPATPPAAAPATPPTSLLDWSRPSLRLGLPVPEVKPVYSLAEQKRLGVASAGTEVRMPLVRVAF